MSCGSPRPVSYLPQCAFFPSLEFDCIAQRQISAMEEQQPWSLVSHSGSSHHGRVCRCRDERANVTLYHLFVRERGSFTFHPFFLRSG